MKRAAEYWPVGMIILIALLAAFFLSSTAKAEGTAEKTYKAKCAVCHGPDGKGDTATGNKMGVRDFGSADVQKETDKELAEIIGKGKNKMPGYAKSLKPEEIEELVAYVRSLGKKNSA